MVSISTIINELLMFNKIFIGSFKQNRIILKSSKYHIATSAKRSSKFISFMVVVPTQSSFFRGFITNLTMIQKHVFSYLSFLSFKKLRSFTASFIATPISSTFVSNIFNQFNRAIFGTNSSFIDNVFIRKNVY